MYFASRRRANSPPRGEEERLFPPLLPARALDGGVGSAVISPRRPRPLRCGVLSRKAEVLCSRPSTFERTSKRTYKDTKRVYPRCCRRSTIFSTALRGECPLSLARRRETPRLPRYPAGRGATYQMESVEARDIRSISERDMACICILPTLADERDIATVNRMSGPTSSPACRALTATRSVRARRRR